MPRRWTLELDGVASMTAAYGTERVDTADICGDTDNGFGLLLNWNLLGDGEHEVVALCGRHRTGSGHGDGNDAWGAEFLRDVDGHLCEVADFPTVRARLCPSYLAAKQPELCAHRRRSPGRAGRIVPGPSVDVGYLENPGPNSFQSGVGVLSGWVCAADEVEITLGDLPRQRAAYGTERLDTQDACGDTDNGFGLLFNWNLLGDGVHEVVAYVDDEELGRAAVQVTSLGHEFLRGAAGECVAADFPTRGETVTLEWQQTSQNFVMTAVE